ncbi:hypothetical protein [Streptomyces sp. NPDC093225]
MTSTDGTDNNGKKKRNRRRPPWQRALVFWSPVYVPVVVEVMRWFNPQV